MRINQSGNTAEDSLIESLRVARDVCLSLSDPSAQICAPNIEHRPIIIAVSGGIDSMVMLEAATRAFDPSLFIVAHFDHGLRDTSADDARFVKSIAEAQGVRFRIGSPIKPYSPQRDGNLEAWAREERYSFLNQIADQEQALAVYVAHHQRDQAETALFRIVTGRSGIGLRRVWKHQAGPMSAVFIRPFLDLPKQTILDAARAWKVTFVEDLTNQDTTRSRNRLRHHVLPELQSINPDSEAAIARFVARFSEQEEFLSRLADDWLDNNDPEDWSVLARCPTTLLRFVITRFGEREYGEAFMIKLRDVDRIVKRIQDGLYEPARIELPQLDGSVYLQIGRIGGLRLLDDSAATKDDSREGEHYIEHPSDGSIEFSVKNGTVQFCVATEIVPSACDLRSPVMTSFKEATYSVILNQRAFESAAAFALRWRIAKDGDVLDLPNRGRRKLKKLFQEFRIPIDVRRYFPVLVDSEDLLIWAPGLGHRGCGDNTSAGGLAQETAGSDVTGLNSKVKISLSVLPGARRVSASGSDQIRPTTTRPVVELLSPRCLHPLQSVDPQ